MTIQQFAADIKALPANTRVLINANFDTEDNRTREYLVRASDLVALFDGLPPPPEGVLRVKVATANGLRVRKTPVNGAIVATLANGTVIEVLETQSTQDWWQIVTGAYAGMYVSAQYTEKVT